ncbi:MAG: TMEM175 family protein [Acidobacteriota bacterium]
METNRLEAFSDGVFAIATTLLVLEIKVPPIANLRHGLLQLWSSYLAYAISFVVIGAIWINHHAMFDWIDRVDQKLLLLNTLHLMFIAFLPFPTAVLAEALHSGLNQSTAVAFYGGTLTIIGVFVVAMWNHASRHQELLNPAISPDRAKIIARRFLVGPTGYALATILAFVSPWISIALFLGLNVYFLWPRKQSADPV